MNKLFIIALPGSHEKGRALLGCLLAMFCMLGSVPLNANPDRALRSNEHKLETLKQRIENIDAELAEDRELHSQESRELRKTEEEISQRLSALREINKRIDHRRRGYSIRDT